jgi:hypothetical protein
MGVFPFFVKEKTDISLCTLIFQAIGHIGSARWSLSGVGISASSRRIQQSQEAQIWNRLL